MPVGGGGRSPSISDAPPSSRTARAMAEGASRSTGKRGSKVQPSFDRGAAGEGSAGGAGPSLASCAAAGVARLADVVARARGRSSDREGGGRWGGASGGG